MVRRARGTPLDVSELDNLVWAFHCAARGKRTQPEVCRFEQAFLQNLADLGEAIRAGRAPRNQFRRFSIRDPKPRVIHAPIFEDRVVHHALMAVLGPTLDRALVDDTFACRVGKGSLAAVQRAQHFVRRHAWYVKVDVAKYFASISHDRLIAALHRKIADSGLRRMVARIVRGFESSPGRGLPIGALTSQYFANSYLGPLDRHLAARPGVRGAVRYMDDVIWWCSTKSDAHDTLLSARALVEDALDLRLKGSGFVQRSCAGLSFLGFRIYPGALKLSRRRQRRYREARAGWEALYDAGWIDALALQRGYDAAFAITAHADALGFRRADLARRPPPDA